LIGAVAAGLAAMSLAPVRPVVAGPRPQPSVTQEAPSSSDNLAGAPAAPEPTKATETTTAEPTPRSAAEGGAPGPTDPASLVNDPTLDGINDTQAGTTLTLSGGNVVAAYADSGSRATGEHWTGWSVSTDGGASFADRGVLPPDPRGDGSNPVLASDSSTGRVYLATMTFSGQDQLQVWRSDDGGVTFGPPVNGTPGFGVNKAFQDRLWIDVDNFPGGADSGQGNVYLAWKAFGAAYYGIYLTRSTDGGATFGPEGGVWITSDGYSAGPKVIVGPDHSVYVFWFTSSSYGPGSLWFRRSTDQGVTFGPPTKVTDLRAWGIDGYVIRAGGFRANNHPNVAVNPVSGDLYLAFTDDPPGTDEASVYLSRSRATTATRGRRLRSSAPTPGPPTSTTRRWPSRPTAAACWWPSTTGGRTAGRSGAGGPSAGSRAPLSRLARTSPLAPPSRRWSAKTQSSAERSWAATTRSSPTAGSFTRPGETTATPT
jgi:hypothetical protein